jgi:PAP2 superfamily
MKKLLIFLIGLSLQLKAQEVDTLISKTAVEHHFFNPKKYQSYIVPVAFVTYGLISLGDNPIRDLDLSTKAELTEDHPRFAAHVDDYLEFAPLIAVYGLDIAGIKGKNSVIDQTAMVLITSGITTAMVSTLKSHTNRLRPDGSAYNSFPSGHTATAFAAAELLHQEFKGQSPWYGYTGYAVAMTTGILRMYNNKHWLSDVVAGAGFGMLSTKLTYLIYPYLKHFLTSSQQQFTLVPMYQNGALGVNFSYKPRK